jgi:hypothetical protein
VKADAKKVETKPTTKINATTKQKTVTKTTAAGGQKTA